MTVTSPTMIRNTMPGPTVFTDDSKNSVEWAGAGDENGGDVQPVPESFIGNVSFQQALTRGIFAVEDADEEIEKILKAHRDQWQARIDRQRNASKEALETPQDEDVLMLECIGPAGHSGEMCKEPVAVKSKLRNEKPPLCQKHSYLASQFISEQTDRMIGGKAEVVWRRASLAARERGTE